MDAARSTETPVHFSVRPRPTPRSSGEYVSSASSYAASQTSSSFTLSSTSSASSSLFDNHRRPSEASSTSNVLTSQLKRLYHEITHLETKIKQADEGSVDDDQVWQQRIQDHKKFVAAVQNFLEISLAPSVPASLRNVPNKYNLVNRLWTHGYSLLLESLRRAALPPKARDGPNIPLEHLTEFIFYAYMFYAELIEEPLMVTFRAGWLEALGDLARYKSMVESYLERNGRGTIQASATSPNVLTTENLSGSMDSMLLASSQVPTVPSASHEAMCDFQPRSHLSAAQSVQNGSVMTTSIGPRAATLLASEPESERWRNVAREWYGMGLNDQPGAGKLHHHIGLLCRDAVTNLTNNSENEVLKGVYHFFKSVIALHPFPLSRESVLPLFALISEESSCLSSSTVLFLTLHAMLYSNKNMELFDATLTRFLDSLHSAFNIPSEREWVMIAVINLAAILEHGKTTSILRMALGGTAALSQTKSNIDQMDVDQEHSFPPSFIYALNVAFSLLSHVLRSPFIGESGSQSLNPYISILLTFLVTILKHTTEASLLHIIRQSVPWSCLAQFLKDQIPRQIWESQGLISSRSAFKSCAIEERWPMLTSSTAPPLPEDWCLRGTEWVGRRVYERGFWQDNGGDDEKIARVEIQYLYDKAEQSKGQSYSGRHYEGINTKDARFIPRPPRHVISSAEVHTKRFVRILRSGIILTSLVPGFSWTEGTTEFTVNTGMEVDG